MLDLLLIENMEEEKYSLSAPSSKDNLNPSQKHNFDLTTKLLYSD